jgi:hypothetical protein
VIDGNADSNPDGARTAVDSGRSGEHRWWRVGADRVELSPSAAGWDARYWREDWVGVPLEVARLFASEPDALAWCRRMAEVMASDLDDEGDGFDGRS